MIEEIEKRKKMERQEPGVALERFDELSGGVVVGNVEPQAVRNGGWDSFPEAKRVSAHKVRPIPKRIVEGIEEEGSRGF